MKNNEQVNRITAYRTLCELLSMRSMINSNQCCREFAEITGDKSAYKKAVRKRDKLDKQIKKQIESVRQLTGDTFANLSDVEVKFAVIQYVSIYSQKICTNRSDDIFDMVAFDDLERLTLRKSLESGLLYHFFRREECRNCFCYDLRSPEIFEQTFFGGTNA